MATLKIKPLSVNEAWQGKRFKSKKYEAYETELYYLLPRMNVPKKTPLRVEIFFGLPRLQDIDSGIKQFLDICQKKYGFNDRDIMELNIKKQVVKKGQEFIKFSIYEI